MKRRRGAAADVLASSARPTTPHAGKKDVNQRLMMFGRVSANPAHARMRRRRRKQEGRGERKEGGRKKEEAWRNFESSSDLHQSGSLGRRGWF